MTRPDADNKENDTVELTADEADHGVRLDKWLSDQISNISRSRVKALTAQGQIAQDGTVVTDGAKKVRAGDVYTLTIPPVEAPLPEPENIPLDILHEDSDLIVLNKPAGMVVHPAAGNPAGTLVNALLHHCGTSLSGIGGVARPGIVHRLDKETSGIIVAAKNDAAHQGLAALFASHDIHRVYLALVHGAPRPGVGRIETGIARSGADRKKMAVADPQERPEARHAVTDYRILKRFGQGRAKLPGDSLASLVSCRLETGRTHQIRVHMAHIGHPLLGDPVYGRGPGLAGLKPGDDLTDAAIACLNTFRRQALHAAELGFVHPVTGESFHFEAPAPGDFLELCARLKDL